MEHGVMPQPAHDAGEIVRPPCSTIDLRTTGLIPPKET